jgi:hypothetical protein
MRGLLNFLVLSLCGIFMTGCSLLAPQYSPSIENVQKLKDAGDFSSRVDKFDAAPGLPATISLRGSSLSSPYDGSYAAYLTEAIRMELSLAGKLKPGTDVVITGTLLKSEIDASGFSTATGDIQARFVVKKGNVLRYDQTKTVHSSWDSSFIGGIAIPKAQQAYPGLVQKLLTQLYEDKDFLSSLK